MLEFHLKINPQQRLTRIPKLLAQTFGHEWIVIPNSKCAIVFEPGTSTETILRSLSLIQKDLEFRFETEKTAKSR